ncbi:MAG: subtype B tannase [Bacillota bacterium]
MKNLKRIMSNLLLAFLVLSLLLIGNVSFPASAASVPTASNGAREYSLTFNPDNYVVKTFTLNNKTISCRAYENIVYVKKPVDIKYEVMNIYVPEEYYQGKSVGAYSAGTAPIFLPNEVGGYMPGEPGGPGMDRMNKDKPNAALVALSKGYVVAAPGARGRTTQNDVGIYTGKAPACIVDLKAAVRYLRYNAKRLPGDTEKIISNGTSAGGALSALLGATGNNKDYEPYLQAIGAAAARDDVYAASCYCPITNLDNADIAYEWYFNGINNFSRMAMTMTPGGMQRSMENGTMTANQIECSNELKKMFPKYLNSLDLKTSAGNSLTLANNGTGSFTEYIKSFVLASAQQALERGADLSGLSWLTIKDGIVKNIDFDQYVRYVKRMKPTTAFDGLDLNNGENDLFGTKTIPAQHFTQFGKDHSTVKGSLAKAAVIKLMNPMNYIATQGTATARYWRIRHGAIDSDTTLAVPVILATKLKNSGYVVDFAVPWQQGHGGDYDLDELFAWIASVATVK